MSKDGGTLCKYGVPITLFKSFQEICAQRRKTRMAANVEPEGEGPIPVDTMGTGIGMTGEIATSFRDSGASYPEWERFKLRIVGEEIGDTILSIVGERQRHEQAEEGGAMKRHRFGPQGITGNTQLSVTHDVFLKIFSPDVNTNIELGFADATTMNRVRAQLAHKIDVLHVLDSSAETAKSDVSIGDPVERSPEGGNSSEEISAGNSPVQLPAADHQAQVPPLLVDEPAELPTGDSPPPNED